MAREPSGFRFAHVLVALCLAAPPILKFTMDRRVSPEMDAALEVQGLRAERDSARQELLTIRGELRSAGLADPEKRWRIVLGDVLPLGDPAPLRDVLWLSLRGGSPEAESSVPAGSAAVWKESLVGRVLKPSSIPGLLRVQTIADPGFRVRFRHPAATGMLWGTKREHEGHAILQVEHLEESGSIASGEPVFTEGQDGVYPSGVLVGYFARPEEVGFELGRGRWLVRAAVVLSTLRRVEIAVDRKLESARKIPPKELRGGGTP
jgi:hypothetical protein